MDVESDTFGVKCKFSGLCRDAWTSIIRLVDLNYAYERNNLQWEEEIKPALFNAYS